MNVISKRWLRVSNVCVCVYAHVRVRARFSCEHNCCVRTKCVILIRLSPLWWKLRGVLCVDRCWKLLIKLSCKKSPQCIEESYGVKIAPFLYFSFSCSPFSVSVFTSCTNTATYLCTSAFQLMSRHIWVYSAKWVSITNF